MKPTFTVDVEKKQVRWNCTPPSDGYINFQTHKFSLLDAIEQASVLLGTDYIREREDLVVGQQARVIIMTLPQTILASPTAEGLMPIENGKGVVGTLGNRKVYWSPDPKLTDTLLLEKPGAKVEILIIRNSES